MEAALTYRAMQAVGRGHLELTEKTIQAPGPARCASASRRVGSAARTPGRWKLYSRSNGRSSQAMRSSLSMIPALQKETVGRPGPANAGHRSCAPLGRA
jgi:hypothetical protein